MKVDAPLIVEVGCGVLDSTTAFLATSCLRSPSVVGIHADRFFDFFDLGDYLMPLIKSIP